MRVLKVEAEGAITSFRYPHFMQTIHPSYEMPPPATIYGHICSALGEWVDPRGLSFAYRFSYRAKVTDLEHIHVMVTSSGKLKDLNLDKVQEGNINPFQRTLLFEPRLTLYVNRPEWREAFMIPAYPVVLGRSQDLFTYTDIRIIDLSLSDEAYFEQTIAPYDMFPQLGKGIIELMPRYLDYKNRRAPTFARYVVLNRTVKTSDMLQFGDSRTTFLIDPESEEKDNMHLGLFFHTFVGDDSESIVNS